MISKFFLLFLLSSILVPSSAEETGSSQLEVIFAGLGRTGSHSLEAALERLGYKACHGHEMALDIEGDHKELAEAVIDHDVDEILRITEDMGYNATLEVHGVFWRQLRERRPKARYIFIVRPFEPWYESMLHMYTISKPLFRYPLALIPVEAKIASWLISIMSYQLNISKAEARDMWRDPTRAGHFEVHKAVHDRYVQEALEITKSQPENTLLFELKDGYPALCGFLAVDPCPDEPFPHLSSRREMKLIGYLTLGLELVVCLVPMIVLWAVYKVGRWLLASFTKKEAKKKLH